MRRFAVIAVLLIVLSGAAGLVRASFISFKNFATSSGNQADAATEASLPSKITFNEHIGPILSDNCYFCHGQDATARKADLRVDRAEFAFLSRKNGLPAIVKGHPETSAIIQRITSKDPNQVMPPPSTHKTLTPVQIALLTRWVKDGAEYQEHWAFVKPERPPEPDVKQAGWVKNPIDSFVLAKMESKGLAPEAEADRRSLLRRVTLDLTGLPPTPDDIARFLADKSPGAYEKLVDGLLASPHYGEHEARYWLDAARFAETVGQHIDEPAPTWPYRDWVIKAFNDNKPFDRFTIEQVAGDLLPNRTIDQQVATGFTRCGISTAEGGSIEAELLATYAKEHVETNAATFLGLTMGCCACHDHKFDPISQKEFYQFTAFFRNTTQKGITDRKFPTVTPYIVLPAEADRARWDALPKEREAAQNAISAYMATYIAGKGQTAAPGILQRLASSKLQPPVNTKDLEVRLLLRENDGGKIQSTANVAYSLTGEPKWVDGGVLGPAPLLDGTSYAELGNLGDFDTKDSFSYGAWVKVTGAPTGALFSRMDRNDNFRGWDLWLENGKPTAHLISFWPRNAIKQVASKPLTPGVWQHVFVTYNGSSKASGLKVYVDGEAATTKPGEDSLTESIRSPAQFILGRRSGGDGAPGVAIQDVRVYKRLLGMTEIKALSGSEVLPFVQNIPVEKLSPAQQTWALNYLLKDDPKLAQLKATANKLKAEFEAISERSPVTMVMDDKPTPAFAYVLKRGQYDQPGEKVEPGVPKVLPPMPKGAPKNRLGLAQWLVDPSNPLLSRVTVNRFWQQFFGVGIVKTSEDFGMMGERPVNQPLLDWLAVEFEDSHWNVKHMLKLMVTSAAYMQSDRITQEKHDQDPENRLVSHGPRFRMDAEMIRDQALAASGLLVPKIGGPSVKPYQPKGIWEVVSMTNETYVPDKGENNYRRSMYTYWKRLAPNPDLATLDVPTRETCTVRRDRTNTPLQALLVENDPQYVEAARNLAAHAISAASDPAARLDYMSERLLARPLDDREKQIFMKSLSRFSDAYTKKPDSAAQLLKVGDSPVDASIPAPEQAAWTMVASQFINLDETLNK